MTETLFMALVSITIGLGLAIFAGLFAMWLVKRDKQQADAWKDWNDDEGH